METLTRGIKKGPWMETDTEKEGGGEGREGREGRGGDRFRQDLAMMTGQK